MCSFAVFSIKWDGRSPGELSYTVLMILGCYILPLSVMVFCYVRIREKSGAVLRGLHAKQALCVDDAVLTNKIRSELKVTFVSRQNFFFFPAVALCLIPGSAFCVVQDQQSKISKHASRDGRSFHGHNNRKKNDLQSHSISSTAKEMSRSRNLQNQVTLP